jgi:hypothetical protein
LTTVCAWRWSIYNRFCDIERDGPIGEITACGGIAIMRRRALQEVDGFEASVPWKLKLKELRRTPMQLIEHRLTEILGHRP